MFPRACRTTSSCFFSSSFALWSTLMSSNCAPHGATALCQLPTPSFLTANTVARSSATPACEQLFRVLRL